MSLGFPVRAFVGIGGLLWLVPIAVMCGQQGTDTQSKVKSMQGRTIEAVLKDHTDRLMSVPGVVGTAQGECAGKPCIKVFVTKKTPELLMRIPSVIEGYTVAIQESGEIRALDPS